MELYGRLHSVLKSLRTAQDYVDVLARFLRDMREDPSQFLRLSPKGPTTWAVDKAKLKTILIGRIHGYGTGSRAS